MKTSEKYKNELIDMGLQITEDGNRPKEIDDIFDGGIALLQVKDENGNIKKDFKLRDDLNRRIRENLRVKKLLILNEPMPSLF